MDANGWRSTQGGESAVDSGHWRSQLLPESRERVVTKIMDTLKKHLPYNDGPGGLQELKEIAARFEEKIFSSATNQTDYLRKISLKMLTMETKTNTVNSKPPNSAVSSNQNPQDSGSNSKQSQVVNQGQQMPRQLGNTQVQARQQLISQNIQNSIAPGGVQGSSGLTSAMSSINGLPSTNMPNVASQNPNLQNIQNMSGVSQNLVGNATGQGISSSMMADSQRQIQGRQHTTPQQQQQQQQSQNQQNYLYQQQLQKKQLMQSNSQQGGNISHSGMQSHMQQQQPNIMQSSQQPSIMQSGSLSGLQQSQQINVQQPTQTGMQQNSQSVFRQQQQQQQQTSMIHQQQQNVQSMQQQQSNATNMQHQLTGQQNSISDMQQQQQRMLSQQNNLPNTQQQQQITSQTNNLPNMRHQKMGSNNGTQSVSTNMQTNQHPLQMMQQSKAPLQTQSQQGNTTLFQSLGQPSSQQSIAHNQSQTGQQQQQQIGMQQQQQKLSMQQQQQLDMQQQTILVQRDMQQRHQTSPPLLHQQNKIDPQKQLFQSQRAVSEASSTSLDSSVQNGTANSLDWQEETYQKIKVLKDTYLPDVTEMYQRIRMKLQQQDSVPQQPTNEQIERMKMFKAMLERIITMLQISKNNISPIFAEKLPSYEKQILTVLHSSRKPGVQLGHSQMQQQHSPITQMQQTHDNQLNAQLQQTDVQNSMSTIPQNTMTGQGNHLSNMQAVSVGSLQQNPTSAPQQVNMNVLQPNLSSVQSNASMLPSQNIKQEQQMLQTQPLKQQRQMQQQLRHRQILQQQQQQPQQLNQQQQPPQQLKPHQHAQFQSQMNDINDLKRQQVSAKSVIQPHSSGQRPTYQHQQMKSTTSFTIPSPQILQTASPQIDQQNILSSLTRTGTPLQSTNSPLMVPSPSTPFVLSPIPGESEKVSSGVSNMGNIRHHQSFTTVLQSQSLAIGTPGISASPLLESTSPENHANASAVISGKSNITELPIDRLIRAVKSLSPSALSDSVSDIGSIVGMFDRIAGSAPGNGSRAAVGEDLAAMTKCCLQANNFSMQDESPGMRKIRRYTTANFVTGSEASVVELTSRSCVKRPRFAANHHSLLEEIREINERLIDTVVDVSDEEIDHIADPAEGGEEGTIVKCSYIAVALSPTLKSRYGSAQMLPIHPLRLLVPNNYPKCSPILLDKFPTEPSNESEDLSSKAKSRFSIHLRTLSQPMSLGVIARMWDKCSRAVILEYAQKNGGGSFSSKYGSWENCLSAV